MKKLSPGIDSRTKFVFKIKDEVKVLSGNDIYKQFNCNVDVWNTISGLDIVGLNNSFVAVTELYFRKMDKTDKLLEVTVDKSKKINVTYNYPCAVVSEDRNLICIKNTFQLEPSKNCIPIGKILKARFPEAKEDPMLRSLRFLLEAKKENAPLTHFLTAEPLKSVRIIDVEGKDKPMIFRFKLDIKTRPYVQTAEGIVIYN